MRLRAASALVLAPLVVACAWRGGWAWDALVLAAGLAVCWEWAHMAARETIPLLLGFGYAALAVLALAWLRADPQRGWPQLAFLFAVVWSSDIGAYAAGRLFGGPRLAPAISPGKTWSGAAGGMAAAMAGGAAVASFWHGRPGPAVAAAAALGVVAQIGDLLESALKRHFGVKDSGRLIPGHGGVLDRLDGLMAAALAACGWAWATGEGSAWL